MLRPISALGVPCPTCHASALSLCFRLGVKRSIQHDRKTLQPLNSRRFHDARIKSATSRSELAPARSAASTDAAANYHERLAI